MTDSLHLSNLTHDRLASQIDQFIGLADDLKWMAWDKESYLLDLPRKWELSRVAEIDGVVAGYALCSKKESTLWLHRLVVESRLRGEGIGGILLSDIEAKARESGFTAVGLKTPSDNESARKFYVRNGYRECERNNGYLRMEKLVDAGIVGIHQPNYVPWLGYFYKLARSDVFVFLDDVLAPSRGYINRSKVLVQGNPKWMTVPVHRNTGFINEMTPSGDEWVAKHLNTLQHSYQKAPYYSELIPELSNLIRENADRSISEFNSALIEHVARLLQIDTPTVRASDFAVSSTGDERLVELVHRVGGTTYLSGRGGDNYQAADTFEAAGIRLKYTGFVPDAYPQIRAQEFVPGLSVLDALFNVGPVAVRDLIDNAPSIQDLNDI